MYKGLTLLAVIIILAVGIGSSVQKRAYVAGHFALTLDGVEAGFLRSAEGGAAYADVIEETDPGSQVLKKRPGRVKYNEFTIKMGAGMSKAMYDWIQSSVGGKAIRKNGAIIAADYDYKESSRREFTNALITEFGMPSLDATSKDPAYMVLKFAPESARYSVRPGDALKGDTKQKKWLPANFRLKIDGLDCSRVNKIEALTIKQKVVELEPGGIEYPNLVVTMPEAFSQTFLEWYESFVIQGKNSDADEKGGTLEFLDQTLEESIATITFQNLGIFKMNVEGSEGGAERLRRIKAELYCERMELNFK
jgi:phage tail-like protein